MPRLRGPYRVEMVNDECITGAMGGDFDAEGRECTLERDLVLTYRGK